MAGLIAQNMQQPQADPRIVERVVMAATHALNTPQVEQAILQAVKSSQDPVQGLAQATMMLMQMLVEKAKGFPPQAFLPAAGQVLGVIAKMAAAAGVLKPTPQMMNDAIQAFLQLVKQQASQQPQNATPPANAQPAAPTAQPAVPAQGA